MKHSDIEIDNYVAIGSGKRHLPTARVEHIPTGIVVLAEHKNIYKAQKIAIAKLAKKLAEAEDG
jgi:protein subunit release factor A